MISLLLTHTRFLRELQLCAESSLIQCSIKETEVACHEVSAEWYLSKRTEFLEDIEIYAEFPPTWDGPSRFDIAANIWSQITLPALFATEEVAHLDVDFEQESMRYTHIVYLKVKNGVVPSD